MSNMELWNKLRMPPNEALKKIKGGRLSGMTDISPQWRYMAITEIYGPCGVGWKYEITKLWTEEASEGQIVVFATVNFCHKLEDGEWSQSIPGIGGSMLVAKEKAGLHTSDEAYKMAVTDALGVAMKMIGVAADVYMNNLDGSKYRTALKPEEKKVSQSVIDQNIVMVKEVAEETDYAKFQAWWPENSDILKKELGTAGAKAVHVEYLKILKGKGEQGND